MQLLELQIAQEFMENIIEESDHLVRGSPEWWQSSFGRYNYLHGGDTLEIWEVERPEWDFEH